MKARRTLARTVSVLALLACAALAALAAPAAALADDAVTTTTDSNGNIVTAVVESDVSPTSTAYWFYHLSALKLADVDGHLDTSACTSMAHMFDGCSSLEDLRIGSFSTASCTDMSGMFAGMTSLKRVTLGANFSFKGNNIGDPGKWAILPTQKDENNQDLKWVNATGVSIASYAENCVTSEELQKNYRNGEAKYAPGTYVLYDASLSATFEASYTPGDGGQGNAPASERKAFGEPFTVPAVTFTRPGYYATSWVEYKVVKDSDGQERKAYSAKHSVGSKMTATRSVTMEPDWMPLQVTFNVPTTIPLLASANGAISSASSSALSIYNSGRCGIAVQKLGADEGEDMHVVASIADVVEQAVMELTVKPRSESGSEGSPVRVDPTAPDVTTNQSDWYIAARGRIGLVVSGAYTWLESVDASSGLDAGSLRWTIGIPEDAQGIKRVVTVSYDANGGSGEMRSHELTPGTAFAAPVCAFEASGKTFKGWKSASGATYQPGDEVTTGEDLTLVAQWG